MARRGANVRLLPPLVFLAPLVAAILAQWRGSWPGPLATSGGSVRLVVGALLVALGVGVFVAGGKALIDHRTTVIPWHEVATLVSAGIYQRTRNPIYLGDALIDLGVAVVTGAWLAIALLPLIIWVMNHFVIAREERYLTTRFGAAYTEYAARVRRWL